MSRSRSAQRIVAARKLHRGKMRWWLIYGPVRSGTTLMTQLARDHFRWLVSDWGLHAALAGPLCELPPSFDVTRPRRSLLAEVLSCSATGHRAPRDLLFKQANLRRAQYDDLRTVLGEPERVIFCLRDPSGFMHSAVRKFPDASLENLRDINYIGTLQEHTRIGGEVFLYHPKIEGAHYAEFLRPLTVSPQAEQTVAYSGGTRDDLVTEGMRREYERMLPLAVNSP